jgi:hypothetical protein
VLLEADPQEMALRLSEICVAALVGATADALVL